jgi:hypothetical protein
MELRIFLTPLDFDFLRLQLFATQLCRSELQGCWIEISLPEMGMTGPAKFAAIICDVEVSRIAGLLNSGGRAMKVDPLTALQHKLS